MLGDRLVAHLVALSEYVMAFYSAGSMASDLVSIEAAGMAVRLDIHSGSKLDMKKVDQLVY